MLLEQDQKGQLCKYWQLISRRERGGIRELTSSHHTTFVWFWRGLPNLAGMQAIHSEFVFLFSIHDSGDGKHKFTARGECGMLSSTSSALMLYIARKLMTTKTGGNDDNGGKNCFTDGHGLVWELCSLGMVALTTEMPMMIHVQNFVPRLLMVVSTLKFWNHQPRD